MDGRRGEELRQRSGVDREEKIMQETQRRFSRRRFFGVLGTVASASVIAACGNRTTSQPSAPAPTAAPAAGAATASATGSNGGPVVVWQTVDYIPSVTQLLRERFSAVAQEKGIQLTFEELPSGQASTDRFNAAVQAGTPPDIWRVFDYQTQYWRIQGQTLDLTDIVKPFASQQGGFWEPVELTAMFDGKWYGAPMAVNCWPFHVRQDLLDANGLAYPRSWTEFREQGRQLTKPPLYYYGQTLGRIDDTNNHFLGMLWTFGGKLQNEDGSLAVKAGDQAWIQTIETIDAMFTEDKIIPPGAITWDNTINNQSYQSEQLVLTSNPTSVYNWLERNKPELAQKTKF
jgi:multiple sugar transport system substrate-binding protein